MEEIEDEMVQDSYRRLEALEKGADNLEDHMSSVIKNWKNEISNYEMEVSRIREDLDSFHSEFKHNIELFLSMIEEFKQSANRDEFTKLVEKIDAWDPENFVSLAEFTRLIRRRLTGDLFKSP